MCGLVDCGVLWAAVDGLAYGLAVVVIAIALWQWLRARLRADRPPSRLAVTVRPAAREADRIRRYRLACEIACDVERRLSDVIRQPRVVHAVPSVVWQVGRVNFYVPDGLVVESAARVAGSLVDEFRRLGGSSFGTPRRIDSEREIVVALDLVAVRLIEGERGAGEEPGRFYVAEIRFA